MEKFRISLLVTVFGGVFLVLGKAILFPAPDRHKVVDKTFQKSTFTPFVLPTVVPLPGWQQSFSKPLPTSDSPSKAVQAKYAKTLAGRQYTYIQNSLPLDIQMLYVVNTLGKFNTKSVKSVVKNYSFVQSLFNSPTLILRHQEGIGYYNLFAYQQRAYLNACINSRGGSTITQLQFMFNRYVYDTRLNRIMPWLLGQAPLKDRRCLWAHLSIPLKNSSPEDAYRILETAWFSWYQWWYPRFPKA